MQQHKSPGSQGIQRVGVKQCTQTALGLDSPLSHPKRLKLSRLLATWTLNVLVETVLQSQLVQPQITCRHKTILIHLSEHFKGPTWLICFSYRTRLRIMPLPWVGTCKNSISNQCNIQHSKLWPRFSTISEVLLMFPNITVLIGQLKISLPARAEIINVITIIQELQKYKILQESPQKSQGKEGDNLKEA